MHGIKRRFAGALVALPVIAGSLVIGGAPAQAITGGKSISVDAFPYSAHIQVHTSVWNHVCQGTLIGPDWVLTSAHCVLNDTTGNSFALGEMKVSVGHERPDWQRTYIPVKRIELYPRYPAHGDIHHVLP